ncbi:hypothetical protein FCG40_04600 [Fimbriimonadia bacterium ATM]|nr:MAG: hypothetical protein EDM73_08405 [Armatimonadota bacterium]MBC6969189.1 hypothetical protein [Armatimonadota bacterium]MCE7900803.1 hypothetical protein [Armatimonadetes bacterium ATM1]MDL1928257.1 hypothetical protein [Fimbriimonadia bacterium ATM]RIJ97674.1 MAG: hypothetical protein DCC45_02990 [Armatimonadota bacterium]
MQRNRKTGAFTLIEVLVVIVIMVIGILTIVRLYPRGFLTLGVTKDYARAQAMARRALDALETTAEDLPTQILAVRYIYRDPGSGYQLYIEADPDRRPQDLGPGSNELLEDGTLVVDNPGGADTFIPYRYYNDANMFRRIVGEGGKIPAPRPIGNPVIYYGGLRVLNFGPIVNDPNLLLVYGANMESIELEGTNAGDPIRNPADHQFAYDVESEQLWLPGNASRNVSYKVNFSYWVNDALGYRKVDLIDVVVTVRPGFEYDVPNNQVFPFSFRQLAGNPAGWRELIHDSVQVNRLFDVVAPGAFSASYPYEYAVLNGQMGILLFNPIGYNYMERRGRQRQPLVAQINYDVYDWHIIRDDFQVFKTNLPLHKLSLDKIKAFNDIMNDKRRYQSIGFPVPDGSGGFNNNQDFVLLDLDTGGIVSLLTDPANPNLGRSYRVDYIRGIVALANPTLPPPADPLSLGQTISIILPDNATVLTGIDPRGRRFRAMYQAHNDWALQVFKAPSQFQIVYGMPLGVSQCYVGSSVAAIGGQPTKIYFPWSTLGEKVTVRQIWYRSGGTLLSMRDQDFHIRAPLAVDPIQLPSIDIREVDSTATNFDFTSFGYAVRGVAGASVRARVIWNTAQKEDVPGNSGAAIAERLLLHEEWGQQWRSVEVETYLSRRDTN